MSMIVAEHVSKSYAHDVLRNISFRLADDSRVGLIGPNGEGKTTLLRILSGEVEPTSGRVRRRAGVRMGYLPQEPPAPAGTTVHQAMLDVFDDMRRTERRLHELADRMGGDAAAVAEYDRLHAAFEAHGGYDYVNRVEAVLTGLGFSRRQWDQPLAELSGGQRTRAYLAKLLLVEPDLLLLDEPTNHLDVDSVEWLERWLGDYRKALVVVSHDRYFLDRTTNRTFDLAFASLETYRGGYSEHLPKRRQRYEERLRQWEARQEYVARTEEFIRRHLSGQRTKEAQGRRTRLERFLRTEAIDKPRARQHISLRLSPSRQTGDLVLRATDLECGYAAGKPIVTADRLEVCRGRRVAIVGANGSGKTTLLRTLLGELPPLGGSVRRGAHVRTGYLSQTQENLDGDASVLDALRRADPGMKIAEARDLLGAMLFSGDDVFKPVRDLSGGQRSRLMLARLAARDANVLLLDEPTNHLDIPSQEILQDVLARFDGTIVMVSHDRYLIDALATDLWVIDAGGVHTVRGGWEDYLRRRGERRAQRDSPSASDASKRSAGPDEYERRKKRRNRRQALRRRHEAVEEEIHRLETGRQRLADRISELGQAGNVEEVERLGRRYAEEGERLDALLAEWEALSEELDQLQGQD